MTHYPADGGHGQDRGHGTGKVQVESKRVKELKQHIEDLKLQLDNAEKQQWAIYDRNARLEADVTRLISTNDTLTTTLTARIEALNSLIPVIQELRSAVAAVPELMQLVQRHEEDFCNRMADATRQRQDVGSEQHRSVVDVWEQFDDLYTQQVRGLANILGARLEPDPDEERRPKAKLVHDMMAVLFPSSPVEPPGPTDLETLLGRLDLPVDQQRLAELTDAARTIHAAAAELGVTYLWTVDTAWIADHTEQIEFWADCDEADPPAFVVRPAFTVNGKVIGTTMLFSSRRPEGVSDLRCNC